ncbi:hypothetical protein CALVIDRAFT_156868 [Calocera viscosa TUFC12733]|uniref:Uncharacterized protein n=1 Tax=Calocera viscosa (strain TUFC12733) TaxID=1330018 RepID=A0A167LB50_CALVF|nr:hypothetical protein CALVIDRAFT_156868 [Calocera viscosa TUFC12733]
MAPLPQAPTPSGAKSPKSPKSPIPPRSPNPPHSLHTLDTPISPASPKSPRHQRPPLPRLPPFPPPTPRPLHPVLLTHVDIRPVPHCAADIRAGVWSIQAACDVFDRMLAVVDRCVTICSRGCVPADTEQAAEEVARLAADAEPREARARAAEDRREGCRQRSRTRQVLPHVCRTPGEAARYRRAYWLASSTDAGEGRGSACAWAGDVAPLAGAFKAHRRACAKIEGAGHGGRRGV